MKCWAVLLLAGVVATAAAQTTDQLGRFVPKSYQADDEEKPWQETEIEPPAFPRQENLREFYVSAVATNKYFIDASTLDAGADGVVRYVLVVLTSGGATNGQLRGHQVQGGQLEALRSRSRRRHVGEVACYPQRVAANRKQAGQSPPCCAEP